MANETFSGLRSPSADYLARRQYEHSAAYTELRNVLYEKYSLPHQDIYGEIDEKINLQGDETVVDIGCGTGRQIETWATGGHEGKLIGINNTETFFATEHVLRESGATNVKFMTADATRGIDLPDNCADIVTSAFVLYHMSEPDKALDEISRILRPGGKFVIATRGTENLERMWRLAGLVADNIGVSKPPHFYDKWGVREAMEGLPTRFEVIDGPRLINQTVRELHIPKEGWPDYRAAMTTLQENMFDDTGIPPPIGEVLQIIDTDIWSIFHQDIAQKESLGQKPVFIDSSHHAIFVCRNSYK